MHMSEYENPPIPEGINVSPTHPLKEFALLLGGVSALLLAVVLSLSLAAGYLVRFIPFSQEQALASRIEQQWLKPGSIAQPVRHSPPGIFGAEAVNLLADIDHILILACGTSSHSGFTARYWLEAIAGVPVTV